MKRKFALAAVVGVGVGAGTLWWTTHKVEKPVVSTPVEKAKSEVSKYWTCPMHPQIHSDKPGECPICHMKLVQVTENETKDEEPAQEGEDRAELQVSAEQLQLVGVQKHKVEKMDLTFHIPVSGRIISPSTVAFQVYEGDLRYIKAGLHFSGESSLFPEAEIGGTVASVDSIVDPTSRTVRVVGAINKGPRGLISETTFRGEVAFELENVLAIPESSVLQTGTGALVYQFNSKGGLLAKKIKLGLKADSFYQVLEGLEAGQVISSGPNFLIDSEAKIRGAGGHAHH